MQFNDWLRAKKAEKKLSNAKIALACKVSGSAVGKWLKGERLPERAQVARLALLFGVSPTTIMRMTDRADLIEETNHVERQQSKAELLAYVPELGEMVDLMMGMNMEDRAAIILLVRSVARGSRLK